jgi:uncharacterized protein
MTLRNSIYLIFATGLFVSCSHSRNRPAASTSKSDLIPVIDVHIHSSFTNDNELDVKFPPNSREELEREFRENNIVAAVNLTEPGGGDPPDLSDLNIIRCYGVSEKDSRKTLENAIQKRGYKCFKIWLGYLYHYATSPLYKPVYETARKFKVPVIFHTGDTMITDGKLKFADPLTIDEVAVDYRDVKFIIAHLGNPWIQSAAEVAYKNPNVYIEASALMLGDVDEKSPDTEVFVVKPIQWAFAYIENPKKFLYGTDWPLMRMAPYLKAYKKAIPREYWCDVFFRNALEVFDFPDSVKKKNCH